MAWWSDFLQGVLPYQDYWLPLAIGLVAGTLCLYLGSFVWRSKKPQAAPKIPTATTTAPPGHDPFDRGSLTEKRKSLRRSGNPVEVLCALPENKDDPKHAYVLDRSIGGLRLAAQEKFTPQTRIVVVPINVVDEFPWVEVDVRTCQLVEGYWELGCQFVKTPQWSILLMFG